MRARIWLTSILAAFSLAPDVSVAGDNSISLPTWAVRVGAYGTNASTSMRVDGAEGNIGTKLRIEEFLNVEDSKNTGFLGVNFNFKTRHFLEFEYFSIGRNGRRVVGSEFEFDGTLFEVGADVSSSIRTEVYRVGYGYQLLRKEQFMLAASVGVHITKYDAKLDAILAGDGGTASNVSEFADVTAPLPVFGVSGAWQLSDRTALVGRAQLLRLEIDGIDGSLAHGSFSLQYDAAKHLGVGVGYDFFDIEVRASNSKWKGNVKLEFHGPMIFVRSTF